MEFLEIDSETFMKFESPIDPDEEIHFDVPIYPYFYFELYIKDDDLKTKGITLYEIALIIRNAEIWKSCKWELVKIKKMPNLIKSHGVYQSILISLKIQSVFLYDDLVSEKDYTIRFHKLMSQYKILVKTVCKLTKISGIERVYIQDMDFNKSIVVYTDPHDSND